MNKQIIFIVLGTVAIISILGGGAWFAMQNRPPPEPVVYVDPHPAHSNFVVEELKDKAVWDRMFAIARDQLEDEPQLNDEELSIPGRRTFVCGYIPNKRPVCGAGVGDDQADAVRQAVQAVRAMKLKAGRVRLKIDVLVHEEDIPMSTPLVRSDIDHLVGTRGYLIVNDEQRSYVLPSEVMEQGVFDVITEASSSRAPLNTAFRERNPQLGEIGGDQLHSVLRTMSYVEMENGGGDIVQLYRISRRRPPKANMGNARESALWAADYLMSAVNEKGKFRYHYHPDDGARSDAYNFSRHAVAAHALAEAYDRTRHPPYLEALHQSLKFTKTFTQKDDRAGVYGGGKVRFVVAPSEKEARLGPTALTLYAIAKEIEATGLDDWKPEGAGYARFIISQQQESGEFASYAPLKAGDTAKSGSVAGYDSQAVLALIRWYQVDGEKLWLDAAKRGADWILANRHAGATADTLVVDHYLLQALSHLYAETGEQAYVDHVGLVGAAIQHQLTLNEVKWEAHPDFKNTFYDPPSGLGGATRGLALVAAIDVCQAAGQDCTPLWELLDLVARVQLNLQYRPETSYWLPKRHRAFGAFKGGPTDSSIRIDWTGHSASLMMGVERLLAAQKEEPKTLPGGPGWAKAKGKAKSKHKGIKTKKLDEMREASFDHLGDNPWESFKAKGKRKKKKKRKSKSKGG